MKVYDISQEVFSCKVYPGDPTPQKQVISSIDDGNLYNLSTIGMCTHNGTHIDAPYHFINEGKTVEQIDINKFVGPCIVITHGGVMTASDAENILQSGSNDALKRILIKGDATVSLWLQFSYCVKLYFLSITITSRQLKHSILS